MAPMNDRPEPRFDWFVPIDGDGSYIGTLSAERSPTFEYLRQVVETAEECGFYSLLIPTRFGNGLFDENAPLAETWTTATALAALSSRIRFLVAVRPGFISVGLFAQMASALDNISGGRLDVNIVPGGIQTDMERLGEITDHSERYARAEEFISACRALWNSEGPVDFDGRFVRLKGALCSPAPIGSGPQFYIGGASERALELTGRQGDVYLCWIEPRQKVAQRLEAAAQSFKARGKTPSFGIRTHVILRDTEEEAWYAADKLISMADERVCKQRQMAFAGSPMVGQQAQIKRVDQHKLDDHLWNGISTVRVNCGTAIVGNPEQVSDELLAHWRMGVDEFILSGFPHVEECLRVSSDLLPLLREKIRVEQRSLA